MRCLRLWAAACLLASPPCYAEVMDLRCEENHREGTRLLSLCQKIQEAVWAAYKAENRGDFESAKKRFKESLKDFLDVDSVEFPFVSVGDGGRRMAVAASIQSAFDAAETAYLAMEAAADVMGTQVDSDLKPKGEEKAGTDDKRPKPTKKDLENLEDLVKKHAPSDPDAHLNIGKGYFGLGGDGDAERALTRSIELDPENPDAWAYRSAARARTDNLQGALADSNEALARDPGNKLAKTIASYAREASKEYGRRPAMPDLGLASGSPPIRPSGKPAGPGAEPVRPEPTAASAAAERLAKGAERKLKIGDLKGALLDASRAIEADPSNPRGWALRAEISNKLRNHDAAVKDAGEALRLDPANAQALRARSLARFELGDYRGALDDADRAVGLEPRNALGHLYRAMAREKLGDLPGALRDYETAARLDASLKPFYDEALARLQPGAPAALPSAKRLAIWALLGLTAVFLALVGAGVLSPKAREAGTTTARRMLSGFGAFKGEVEPKGSGTLPPGTVLGGNYRVETELGRGGMGVVYGARDEALDRRVAIKQLKRELRGSGSDLERFLREARLMAKLDHPNLASVLSVVQEDGEVFLVFEFIDGRPLDRVLDEAGRLELERARGLLADVCAALEYAHGRNVIHRDLKPSNVMLETGGRARVMDFGIAHQASTTLGSTSTAPWGTPAYMAPEQGMGRVSKRTDLYALGVMTYEMLAGERPFSGPNLLDDKLNKFFSPISRLRPELARADAFFDRALEPDPAERFGSAAEFLDAFSRLG